MVDKKTEIGNFVSAEDLERRDTRYKKPHWTDLDSVCEGDYIEVSAGGIEKIWVKILEVYGQQIKARITQDLISTSIHGLERGQMIKFHKRHVLNIWMPEEKDAD